MGDRAVLDFLSPDQAHWVSHLATRKGVSEQEVIRRAVEEFARKEGVIGHYPPSGIVGMVNGEPVDWLRGRRKE